MADVIEAVNPYSRLISWEVWNFMSIEHGKVEFDERNIINLKGYNDSGKSALLQALKILIANTNPSKQVSFIQDDKDYFRVLGVFDDGVQILRDKYINGQSLYEMYKDGECIYTTKNGKALTRVTEVPKPIADYLGLITYDGVCLNARACFEKQIGVQTTGSENYKMFNTVLKSEEIASASNMLNNDKNSLSSDINGVENEVQSYKNMIETKSGITEEMISYLKEHDFQLDTLISQDEYLHGILNTLNAISAIPDIPELPVVDSARLYDIYNIATIKSNLDSISVTPELPVIVDSQLSAIINICNIEKSLSVVVIPPEVSDIDNTRLSAIQGIAGVVSQIQDCDDKVSSIDTELSNISVELERLQAEMKNHGVRMVKCPGCGQIFDPDKEHVHE